MRITSAAIGSLVTAVIAGGLLVGAAAPAMAATSSCATSHRCAYDFESYGGTVLFDTTAASGTVDVADNKTASVQNRRTNSFCAVNVEGGINVIRFIVAGNTNAATFGTYNDTTDFFWVKGSGSC